MKKHVYLQLYCLCFLFLLQNCQQNKSSEQAENKINTLRTDFPAYTKNDGALTVLMDNSLSSYFIYQGQPMGYEYEMLALFAAENDLTLEIKIIGHVENILDSLLAGEGDLVAANLSISSERMEKVAFTDPLFRTKQILVQRLPDDIQKLTRDEIEKSLIRDRLDLESKDVMVRKNSSYELILNNLVAETGLELNINYASGDLVTEHL
ncbi:MAG: transporter substrate-binding domain-containing protein, partial [Cyclobacteriaceae bacterium]|nr:transporter substrate-binding domain-containing protein [Cyclobacteriaceae bacterium]